jgi:Trp operon repressor
MTLNKEERTADLFKTIAGLGKLELVIFLQDILTPQELEELGLRWEIIQLLNAGMPQREIAAKLKCSVTTVSRGSGQLKYGFGGFDKALGKINQKKTSNKAYVV